MCLLSKVCVVIALLHEYSVLMLDIYMHQLKRKKFDIHLIKKLILVLFVKFIQWIINWSRFLERLSRTFSPEIVSPIHWFMFNFKFK